LRSLAVLLDFFRVFLPPALGALKMACRHTFKVLYRLRPFYVFSLFHGVIMRLLFGISLLVFASVSIHNQDAQNSQCETRIKQPQPAYAALTWAIHQPETQAEHDDSYDARKDWLYRAYLAATILGVFVALGGIYVIWKQTEATKQSVQAAERSVKLQEIGQKQWINLSGWLSSFDTRPDKAPHITLAFDIVNPTKLPLTLKEVSMTLGKIKQASASVSDLAPDNPFIMSISIDPNAEQMEHYRRGKLVLNFSCCILFIDCFGKTWEQLFERIMVFNPSSIPEVRVTKNELRESNRTMPPYSPNSQS
jgi:hypothetical protein